jgi:hypothetical protein
MRLGCHRRRTTRLLGASVFPPPAHGGAESSCCRCVLGARCSRSCSDRQSSILRPAAETEEDGSGAELGDLGLFIENYPLNSANFTFITASSWVSRLCCVTSRRRLACSQPTIVFALLSIFVSRLTADVLGPIKKVQCRRNFLTWRKQKTDKESQMTSQSLDG